MKTTTTYLTRNRSTVTVSSTKGRCTLTATCSPLCNLPRYTCSDAPHLQTLIKHMMTHMQLFQLTTVPTTSSSGSCMTLPNLKGLSRGAAAVRLTSISTTVLCIDAQMMRDEQQPKPHMHTSEMHPVIATYAATSLKIQNCSMMRVQHA